MGIAAELLWDWKSLKKLSWTLAPAGQEWGPYKYCPPACEWQRDPHCAPEPLPWPRPLGKHWASFRAGLTTSLLRGQHLNPLASTGWV